MASFLNANYFLRPLTKTNRISLIYSIKALKIQLMAKNEEELNLFVKLLIDWSSWSISSIITLLIYIYSLRFIFIWAPPVQLSSWFQSCKTETEVSEFESQLDVLCEVTMFSSCISLPQNRKMYLRLIKDSKFSSVVNVADMFWLWGFKCRKCVYFNLPIIRKLMNIFQWKTDIKS